MSAQNMIHRIINEQEQHEFKEFVASIAEHEGKFLLRNDILLIFKEYCETYNKNQEFLEKSSIALFLRKIQEVIVRSQFMVLMHRYGIARYRFYMLRMDGEYLEEISVSEYLDIKDTQVMPAQDDQSHLHIDFMPFYDFSPSIKDTRSVGNGIRYLNRYLSSKIFQNPVEWNQKLFNFIRMHSYEGQQLLVNSSIISDHNTFYDELGSMIDMLSGLPHDDPYSSVERTMKQSGFEPGWGNTVGRIINSMQLLYDLINEPDDSLLEEFISMVPMPLVSKIAILSPHGWFGQENVLGKPDTGGQVIYILDQVRALEKHLKESIQLTGLDVMPQIIVVTRLIPEAGDTTCNQQHEKIHQTENGWILRIPFRDNNYNTIPHWISRFHVWPYLERFARDATAAILSEFQGRPDLIIGNYSDGNLVATLMSNKLDVIQCTIAHALEKTKYLFSDLYWQDMEEHYNFSLQYTADMLSMNKSDFIIASTYQEIAGTEFEMGQYESYQHYTMPGLFQVHNGVNLFAPKFNVIPPGVDENLYGPYHEKENRVHQKINHWKERLFGEEIEGIFGTLDAPEKPPIFTMARFDKIKNITGLIEAFGMSKKLQETCNLIFSAASIYIEDSRDDEEKEQIRLAYELIDKYDLHGKIRWLPSINKLDTGEVYRIIADYRGVFVQPALFEAFGLTILEAMLSGLPTFGPKFGGPVEIIQHEFSGFLMNTSHPELIAESLENFFMECEKDAAYWNNISENGINRVRQHFTWKRYSSRLINLAKLYGFWRFSESAEGKKKMDRYADMMYHFLFRQRAGRLIE